MIKREPVAPPTGIGGTGRSGRKTSRTCCTRKREGCDASFQPSQETLDSDLYPRFGKERLGRFAEVDVVLGNLAFAFFSFMMPFAVIKLLVDEVRRDGRVKENLLSIFSHVV